MSIIFLLLFFITLFIIARKPRPVKDKKGTKINNAKLNTPEDTFDKSTLTVATFNIQTGKNTSGKRDISRSAEVIKNADLVGVQEVYTTNHLQAIGIGTSQTKALADAGNFNWLPCASQTRWFREHRGNLILSKLPISDWKIKQLPSRPGKNYRNMTVSKVIWQGKPFHFINTHLQTRHGKEEQLELVLAEFSKYSKAILVGDFNARPNTAKLINLLENPDITDSLGVTNINPDEEDRVDWILTKGFKIHHTKMVARGISDHPYYQATVSFIE